MDCDIFQQDEIETQYSIIPLFHYSNCERSELGYLLAIGKINNDPPSYRVRQASELTKKARSPA